MSPYRKKRGRLSLPLFWAGLARSIGLPLATHGDVLVHCSLQPLLGLLDRRGRRHLASLWDGGFDGMERQYCAAGTLVHTSSSLFNEGDAGKRGSHANMNMNSGISPLWLSYLLFVSLQPLCLHFQTGSRGMGSVAASYERANAKMFFGCPSDRHRRSVSRVSFSLVFPTPFDLVVSSSSGSRLRPDTASSGNYTAMLRRQ